MIAEDFNTDSWHGTFVSSNIDSDMQWNNRSNNKKWQKMFKYAGNVFTFLNLEIFDNHHYT